MIKIENVVLASPEQMEFIIEGMRNPMNSWEKSNSGYGCDSGLCSGHCAFSRILTNMIVLTTYSNILNLVGQKTLHSAMTGLILVQ